MQGKFINGYYVLNNNWYGQGTPEYKQARLFADNMGGGKFKNGYYVVGNRWYGKGTSAYKNAMARMKNKKTSTVPRKTVAKKSTGFKPVNKNIKPVKKPAVNKPDITEPKVIKNKYGGYEYNPAFGGKNGTEMGPGAAQYVYGRDPSRTSTSPSNKIPDEYSKASSQDTYVKDGKVYHSQTGTFISDLAAQKEYKPFKDPNAGSVSDYMQTAPDGDATGLKIPDYNKTFTINGKKYQRSQLLWEAKNYGEDYVIKKYGQAIFNREKMNIEFETKSRGRATADSSSNGKLVKVRIGDHYEMREIGNSSLNAIRDLKDGSNFDLNDPVRAFKEGGVAATPEAPATFKRQQNFNLSNNDDLAQGYEHPWAQTTSISALISGQLRQAANAGPDYWDVWSQNKGGTTTLRGRPTGPFGADPVYTPTSPTAGGGNVGLTLGPDGVVRYNSSSSLATSNPMGAFGTNAVMGQEDTAPTSGRAPLPDQMDPTKNGNIATSGGSASNVYNPWSTGQGGEYNAYGPNPQHLAQSSMEAMALANAYFAPQRLELANQLGDMETDMRRLAVNLGRQVDDPVLQAKMYKEAMSATRALDVQQNTFAFQMAEQRRREELSNFQFYDQMAQQEYQLRLQNAHFYDELEIAKYRFNLDRWQVENHPMYNGGSSASTGAAAPTAGAPSSTAGGSEDTYGNLLGNTNPIYRSYY